jgi:hypothetical protein
MPKTIEIPLETPLKGHGGNVTKVVVREPTFEEYVRFGDPYILVPMEGGGYYPSEDRKIIESYMGVCVTEPDILICRGGGFALARQIKDAILSFFLPASAEDAGLKT